MQKKSVKVFSRRKPLGKLAHDTIMRRSRRALKRIWKYHKRHGYVFLAARNPITGQWNERAFSLPYDSREVRKFQSKYDPENFDYYYCPNIFSQPKRLARFALQTPYAWCDIDNADPLQFKPPPTILISTSPDRYQGIWQFEELHDPKEAEQLSRRLAYEWGGDRGGWSVTKMLRLPGTLNHKPAYNRPEVIVQYDDERFLGDAPTIPASRLNPISELQINPLRYDRNSFIKKYKRRLPPNRKRLMEDTAVRSFDRSRIIFMIVAALHKAGAVPDEIGAVLWQSPYFISKHGYDGKKLTSEIQRISDHLAGQTGRNIHGCSAAGAPCSVRSKNERPNLVDRSPLFVINTLMQKRAAFSYLKSIVVDQMPETTKTYLLSRSDLKARGVHYSNVHRLRLEGDRTFPRRIYLLPARVAWIEAEVEETSRAVYQLA
jgi:predicted DNA-binding transcriptional regulator AlpA